MRIVPNLSDITECPNCGSRDLMTVQNVSTWTQSKFCHQCGEEIQEGNITTDNLSLQQAISVPYDESRTIKMPKMITRGQETANTLRQEIDRLRYNIHDTHSMMLVNKLTDILNLIADYIEES